MTAVVIGSLNHKSPLALAEQAIAAIAARTKTARARYAVCIDLAGRVTINRACDTSPRFIVAVATRKSCPDWLEGELKSEWGDRNA